MELLLLTWSYFIYHVNEVADTTRNNYFCWQHVISMGLYCLYMIQLITVEFHTYKGLSCLYQ